MNPTDKKIQEVAQWTNRTREEIWELCSIGEWVVCPGCGYPTADVDMIDGLCEGCADDAAHPYNEPFCVLGE